MEKEETNTFYCQTCGIISFFKKNNRKINYKTVRFLLLQNQELKVSTPFTGKKSDRTFLVPQDFISLGFNELPHHPPPPAHTPCVCENLCALDEKGGHKCVELPRASLEKSHRRAHTYLYRRQIL